MTTASGRPDRRRLRGAAPAAAGAALALGLLTGCGGETPSAGPATDGPTVSVAQPVEAAPLDPRTVQVAAAAPLATSAPVAVRVPSIGVDSSLVPLGLNADDTVEVPPLEEAGQAGYYRYGPTPGARGPAVILGHIDGGGERGVFSRLQELTTGQEIEVTREDGRTATFTVTSVRHVPKSAFPTQEVYGPRPDAELRLISCGGVLDRRARTYLDNVIAFATLTSTSGA